ncbi:hypothetical protein BV22DRAFT_727252 [Leucogyrophana mollusca]|uniref:Uncharacterized protein n=1 Tax=Leucogyrophana mollusca TaxID=85980 RepID=A0ACB8B9C4_9AGAM|nr:hypothetical protein BV22DRAFT_727252 [Leucogyrophana mollusca]
MPQLSPLEHSLLRSGFQVVDQNADILALPKDYKPQLPAAVANLRSAAAKTPSSDYVSVGDNTIYTGGEDTLTALRFYFTDKECYNLVGMQIGYPNNVWTKIMGKETQYTENWNRQDGEKITFTSSMLLRLLVLNIADTDFVHSVVTDRRWTCDPRQAQ